MSKVYIVTKANGDILECFSTREKAEQWIKFAGDPSACPGVFSCLIHEKELDPPVGHIMGLPVRVVDDDSFPDGDIELGDWSSYLRYRLCRVDDE